MSKTNVKINLNELQKLQNKLKEYEKPKSIIVPYTQEQWNKMTEYEKEQVKQETQNKYIEDLKKDLFE